MSISDPSPAVGDQEASRGPQNGSCDLPEGIQRPEWARGFTYGELVGIVRDPVGDTTR